MIETDFLVLGSGIAGLAFALRAAVHGRVVVVTKRGADESNTRWAQGGIASVMAPTDSVDAHVADTLLVGDGLCHEEVVRIVCGEGPGLVRELVDRFGVEFDRDADGGFDLAREGGHSARRVLHARDTTGLAIASALLAAARADERITILDQHMAIDLLTMAKYGGPDACFGAYVLDQATQEVAPIVARATILATGGAGKVYLYTSNPDIATGDGVAMAYRAGARVANLEFFQFHPTCLYHPQAKSFLISEALRGEGGVLRTGAGEAFMERYDPRGNLASRDIVARAIDDVLKKTGDDSVFLDMTHLPRDFLAQRFPAIHERCLALGIDMRSQPIPVVPAAHYSCGGVVADERGRTSLRNLYAVGEVAMSGLHGACRLASNSLLEGLVFGARAALDAKDCQPLRPPAVAPWYAGGASDPSEAVVVSNNWDEIRRTMWNYVGIVRTDKRLERARRRLELIGDEIREYYWNFKVNGDLIELRNLALVAHLIVESARRRKESRGLHYTLDYPAKDSRYCRDIELRRGDGPMPA